MSPHPNPTDSRTDASSVADLLEQRARVLEWLARLEEQGASARSHVVARIRADYEARLQATVELLSGHLESLRAELGRARSDQRDADGRREAAADALDEMRLRHLIGELGTSEWEERRAELEADLAAAEDASGEARAAVEHLEEVLLQIETGVGGEGEAATLPEAHAEVIRTDRLATVAPRALEDTLPDGPAEQDVDFLEELDRAIAASSELADPRGEELLVEARPTRGVKCADCGYTNDVDAWYCGVCGVDLT